MQQVSTALFNALEAGIDPGTGSVVRDLTYVIEFYEPDVLPGADGFDPADASECFAPITITWLGQAYRRAVISAGNIQKTKGARSNRCTVRLSNADENRYVAQWATTNQVEGMRMVIRLISRSASAALTDSAILFVGRCEIPDGFDVIQGSITATADFGGTDMELPPDTYTENDPEGRSPADPLNEGIPFITLTGTFQHPDPSRNFWQQARRFWQTQPWSSFDNTPLGEPKPIFFGRTQWRTYRGVFADTGRRTVCLDFIGTGPIAGVLNFRMDSHPEYRLYFTPPQNITYHLGLVGTANGLDPLWPDHGYLSRTAYVSYDFTYIANGAFSQIDAGHDTVMTVMGMVVALPDASGVFNQEGWTDNGAYITRHILTDPKFFNNDPAFVEDSACWATGVYNDRPVVDETNSEIIVIPSPDFAAAGDRFVRFHSTGLIDINRARYVLGLDTSLLPEEREATDFHSGNPFAPTTILTDVTRLRKRFTTNSLLRKRVKGVDYLFKHILESYRGFPMWNWRGKIEVRSERPHDFSHLRSGTSAGATSLPVEDVTPWKATGGLWGKALVGTPLTTSEIRKVTAAAYTTDANGITLTASTSGGVSATASGATLSGGDASNPATGQITMGGTPAAGNSVTVVINGISIVYTLEDSETVATVAYMVAKHINANTQIRRFVSATDSAGVVTISSKWGVLTLSSSPSTLANTHGGPVSNPTTAPAGVTASGSGSTLAAGTYRVAYANRNARGSTYVTPHSSVAVTAGQQINIPALAFPAGVTARDWFVSKAANDPEMVLHTRDTTAGGFAITVPPDSTADFPPEYNTTGEEVVRVALSLASNNQTAAILAQSGLTRGNVFADTYRGQMRGSEPSYTQIKATHISAKDDFATRTLEVNDKARRARLGQYNPKELDLTAVDNYRQARALSYYDFAKFIDHHNFSQGATNGTALLLEEDDLVPWSDDSCGHVNVLTTVEDFTLDLNEFTVSIQKARLYTTQMRAREIVPKTRPLVPSVLQYTATVDTLFEAVDAPAIYPEHFGLPGLYVVVSRDADTAGDWRGSYPWADFGAGDRQLSTTPADVTAAIGVETGTPLTSPSDFSAVDTTSTLEVTLENDANLGDTITTSEMQADPYANLIIYGDEYLQYATKTLIDADLRIYELTDLLRGRFGTEGYADHSGGERVATMAGALFVPVDVNQIDETFPLKLVTVTQDVSAATAENVTFLGGPARPLRVTGLVAVIDAGTNWQILGQGHDYAGEAVFFINVLDGGGSVVRTIKALPGFYNPALLYQSGGRTTTSLDKGSKYALTGYLGNSASGTTSAQVTAFFGSNPITADPATLQATWRIDDVTTALSGSVAFSSIGFNCAGVLYELRIYPPHSGSPVSKVMFTVDGATEWEDTSGGGEANLTRYRVERQMSTIRLYRNESEVPFHTYEGAPVNGPLTAQVTAGARQTMAEVGYTTAGVGFVVTYTEGEQVADFGSAQSSLRVEVYQQRTLQGVEIDGHPIDITF